MASDNETRETIADIVAQIRAAAYIQNADTPKSVLRLADRIEAAWKREARAIATEHAVLPAVCITKPSGNAAAMREALKPVLAVEGAIEQSKRTDTKITCREDERLLQCLDAVARAQEIMQPVIAIEQSAAENRCEGNATALRDALVFCLRIIGENGICGNVYLSDIQEAHRSITAALSAPPRNCDRFADETDAQIAFLNEMWLISVTKETALERDRFENWTDEMKSRYAKWLLAPAAERKGEGDENK